MALVGGLVMAITAKTGKFKTDMRKASTTVTSFKSRVQGAIKGVANFAAGFAKFAGIATVVAGVAAAFLAVRTAIRGVGTALEDIDKLAKLADRLRVSTRSLTAFGLAAEIGGSSVEALQRAIEDMTRRLGEAAGGAGEATRGLEILGLKAEDLINLRQDEAFKQIADRIAQTENVALKAAAAYAIFGRKGRELLTVLSEGRAGLEAFEVEADKLGITFTRIDAAKIEAANDSITRLKALFTGLTQQFTIRLAPIIEALATKATEFGTSGTGAVGLVDKAFRRVTNTVLDLLSKFDELRIGILKVSLELKTIGELVTFIPRLLSRGAGLVTGTGMQKRINRSLDLSRRVAEREIESLQNRIGQRANQTRNFLKQTQQAFDAAAAAAIAPPAQRGFVSPNAINISDRGLTPQFGAGFQGGAVGARDLARIQERILTEQQQATDSIQSIERTIETTLGQLGPIGVGQ